MKLTKQRFLHEPEKGVYGDCLRTAIACLLDLDPDEVPHFNDRSDGRTDEDVGRLMNAWLLRRGLVLITTYFGGDTDIEAVLATATFGSAGMPFLFSGRSRTGCDHVVIGQKGEIVWDPSQVDSGIVGPMSNGFYMVEWLVRPAS